MFGDGIFTQEGDAVSFNDGFRSFLPVVMLYPHNPRAFDMTPSGYIQNRY